MPISVALGPHFEEFVKAQLRSGRYNDVSEVVREGLRMLEDQEKWRQLELSKPFWISARKVSMPKDCW